MRWCCVSTKSLGFRRSIARSRCYRYVPPNRGAGPMSTVRHGTQTMIAALEIATGKVVAHVRNRRTSVNFLRFMNEVVRAYPNRELHVVVDNLNIHKNEAARRWL